MGNIKVLEESLINKIAAGEVIERPASVVKELIENAIDAEADDIAIEIVEGGKTQIKVVDNGIGMDRDDAKNCFLRHSTSKINSTEDLFLVNSLGFRGEALASIAEISNVKLVTRQENSIEGTSIEVEGGKILNINSIGRNIGTSVEVRHLFFNTPARKKYLKDINYEFSLILELVTRLSLIYFDTSFKLVHNNEVKFNVMKTKSLFERVVAVYGGETAKSFIKVEKKDRISINGYISKPSLTRSNTNQQNLFVNNRYVKCKAISKAIYDAYGTLLFNKRHPIFTLHISLDPSLIDVNVHPTKKMIRILKEKEVYNFVRNVIKEAFSSEDLIPKEEIELSKSQAVKQYSFTKDKQTLLRVKEKEPIIPKIDYDKQEKYRIGPLKILAQVNRTYILAENYLGLLIIDQHAAQERALYEDFILKYKDKKIKKQNLVKPKIIELTPNEAVSYEQNKEVLTKLGFEIEAYGENSYLIRSVPYIFERFESNLLKDMLNEIDASQPNTSKSSDAIQDERIIRFACRKAIKAGEELTLPQMESLVNSLEKCLVPFTCPHGRPTLINITIAELERKFKRTGM